MFHLSRRFILRASAPVAIGSIYAVDQQFNASSITRTFRTLATCAIITIDYKFNFTVEKSHLIPELHERVADRVYDLLTSNGGLYIKIGQAIGANAAFLPKPMQAKFAKLFDDAPQIPYSSVLSVFKAEFGRPPAGPGGVFEIFDEKAVASASIAQVHKAKLRPEDGGQWVAVKIQKPDVGKQMEWDLGAYRAVMWMFEHWAFDLPVYFVVDFVSRHLRQELDFVLEASNAKKTAQLIASEPRLVDKVYVPKVYDTFSTKKVMTAEWIDGVRLSDRKGIAKLMGEPEPTSLFTSDFIESTPLEESSKLTYKPLKGGYKAIMQTMVELFSAQMFNWGFLHCDPHPGNVIIRPHPSKPNQPQFVLLDHGLYVQVSETFRKEWANLWKALLTGDYQTIKSTANGWGVGLPDLFASATLMRAHVSAQNRERFQKEMIEMQKLSEYEQSVRMKAKLKGFLIDTDRMPKALIFLMRNMRIVQGNNLSFGSPVNRVNITGIWASRSLTTAPNLPIGQRLREYWRIKQWFARNIGLGVEWEWAKGGFEEELEKGMRVAAQGRFGMEIPESAFESR